MGVLSAIFWVPGGLAGIYGIKNAGLAVSVGIWSSINVITSFAWGIFIFGEAVHSQIAACCAGSVLILGLWGMSLNSGSSDDGGELDYDEKQRITTTGVILEPDDEEATTDGEIELQERVLLARTVSINSMDISNHRNSNTTQAYSNNSRFRHKKKNVQVSEITERVSSNPQEQEFFDVIGKPEHEQLLKSNDDDIDDNDVDDLKVKLLSTGSVLVFGKVAITKRQLGIAGAIFNGVWGGSNTVPLHYVPNKAGPDFIVSFGIGAAIVTFSLWILRYLYYIYLFRSPTQAYYVGVPSLQLSQIGTAGALAGLLYCVGLFGTVFAVTTLGQSIGNSFIQMSMFVSGLWGVLFFHEIKGPRQIMNWFLSAVLAFCGIIWLSYEHVGSVGH